MLYQERGGGGGGGGGGRTIGQNQGKKTLLTIFLITLTFPYIYAINFRTILFPNDMLNVSIDTFS